MGETGKPKIFRLENFNETDHEEDLGPDMKTKTSYYKVS
jgi:hypothetical protein